MLLHEFVDISPGFFLFRSELEGTAVMFGGFLCSLQDFVHFLNVCFSGFNLIFQTSLFLNQLLDRAASTIVAAQLWFIINTLSGRETAKLSV
ncbi:hypothetical protein, partial [Endozoicomonas sp. ONNA1]|uniref:hypothetical protein n=1 Tax=Endozoicomonas sp. ONNA1 TaxID=2828740 RepID=UPI0021490CD2